MSIPPPSASSARAEPRPGAPFESEARWLLAQALEQLNKPEESKRELARLVQSGLNDEFTRKARAKLESLNK